MGVKSMEKTKRPTVKVNVTGGEEISLSDYRDHLAVLNQKPFLTKREAVELFGIGLNRLAELMKMPDCPFRAGKGSYAKVHRESFEQYICTHDVY